jgi:serine/threonine protein kinase
MRLGVHHYVTRLLDFFECPEYYYMVLELESGGSLLQYLKVRNQYITEQASRMIALKLA